MINEFIVVGEHRDDKRLLLLLGVDGRYYRYRLGSERLRPVTLDGAWAVYPGKDAPATEPQTRGRDRAHRRESLFRWMH
jgi:hypothetical protein